MTTILNLPAPLVTSLFTQFPVKSLKTFALTCKQWRLCTQREEYYQFLIQKLRLHPKENEKPWQTFYEWANSRNYVILLDTSFSMNYHPAISLLPWRYQNRKRINIAHEKALELAKTLLPNARRGLKVLRLGNKIRTNIVHSERLLGFLKNPNPGSGFADITDSIQQALQVHNKQAKFPRATRTEVYFISDFDFDSIELRESLTSAQLQLPQVLFRCINVATCSLSRKTAHEIQKLHKERSAKNRWHLSITFPKRQCR